MCLSQVTKRYAKPRSGIGYKILNRRKIRGKFIIQSCTYFVRWSCRWIEGNGKGDSGFHIYASLQDAKIAIQRPFWPRGAKIYKVAYRNAIKEGIGDGGWNMSARIIIAKKARLARRRPIS